MFTVIPGNPRELHRYLSTRFLVSGIAISLLVGALVYYWESWRVEKMVFELAVVSAMHFDSPAMRKLLAADNQTDHPELAGQLEKSSFVGIRIFDLSGKVLMQAWRSEATNLRSLVQAHRHDFPQPGKYHNNWLMNEGGDFVQVVIPLPDSMGITEAYFEGIYRLDAGTQYARKHQARSAVLTSLVVVISALLSSNPSETRKPTARDFKSPGEHSSVTNSLLFRMIVKADSRGLPARCRKNRYSRSDIAQAGAADSGRVRDHETPRCIRRRDYSGLNLVEARTRCGAFPS